MLNTSILTYVDGDLDLSGCTVLMALPKDLKVKGDIRLPEHLAGQQIDPPTA